MLQREPAKGRSGNDGSVASLMIKPAKDEEDEEEGKKVGAVGISFLPIVEGFPYLYTNLSLLLGKKIS